MASKRLAVLDVGSGRLTLALQDGRNADNIIFKESVAYDGYQDGEFLNEEGLFSAISGLIEGMRERYSVSGVIVGVPGEFTAVVCKNVGTSFKEKRKITDSDIEKLLYQGDTYENHPSYKTINSSPIHYLVERKQTHNAVGYVSDKLTAYISYILCERRFISLLDAIAERLGIKFIYSSTVLSEVLYLIEPKKRDEGVILCDIGYISSTVCYAKGDGVLHSLSFSKGGGHIAAELLAQLNIPFEHGLELIKKVNLNLEGDERYVINDNGAQFSYDVSQVNEVVGFEVIKLSETVKEALERSKTEILADVPIVLTGSGISTILGSREVLTEYTKRDVEIASSPILQFSKPGQSAVACLVLMQNEKFGALGLKYRLASVLSNLFERFRRK